MCIRDRAFIILDEAQNTTSEQMKMFLTRMGMGSKMVITGDVTQIDLPTGKKSGLIEALEVLKGVNDIGIVTLSHRDVVRHELVQAIVRAYETVSYTHLSTTYTDHFTLYFSHNMTFCQVFLSCQYVKELLLLCNRN